jgi:hypothetical protein
MSDCDVLFNLGEAAVLLQSAKLLVDRVNVRGPGIIGTRLTLRFDVPHCQTHRRGVECGGTPSVVLVGPTFRSYRYYREFMRMNGIDPRRAGR